MKRVYFIKNRTVVTGTKRQHCISADQLSNIKNQLSTESRTAELLKFKKMNQVLHYKICLIGPGDEPEIRRLIIDKIVSHNFYYLKQKIMTTFPNLKDVPISIYWKDREGDSVKICSDDELVIALKEMESDPLKKIHVTTTKPLGRDGILHTGVFCDSCDQPVEGFRYKCLLCMDYNLCSDCERSQIHSEHPILRIPKPLSPEIPLSKRFSKDIHKMCKHLERLFHQTSGNVDRPNDSKNAPNEKKKQYRRFCHNEAHNIIANLVVEKIRGISANGNMPSHFNRRPFDREPQNINVLTNEFNSLSIDVSTGDQMRDNSQLHHESLQTINEQQTATTHEGAANTSVANTIHSTASSMSEASNVLSAVSAVLADPQPIMSQMDAAPIPVDPTPVLQAQLTPPSTVDGTATIPVPSLYAASSAPRDVSPKEDVTTLDASWTVVNSGMEDSAMSLSKASSVDSFMEVGVEPLQSNSPGSERIYPQLAVPKFSTNIDPVEETLMRLKLLGFEDGEWLREIVENKKGNIKEVLKFLSPAPKAVSSFPEFD